MYNTGQTCCAAKRFIVVDQVADKFLEQFKAALGGLKAGDPLTRRRLWVLCRQNRPGRSVEAGRRRRRSWGEGSHGRQADRSCRFVHAADDPDRCHAGQPGIPQRVLRPVAMFFRVKNEDEAIALANNSDFGLGGSVFTGTSSEAKRVASRVETGMMFINNINWSDAELPFGGIKKLRLRARTRRHGHPGVREQEAGSLRAGGSAGVGRTDRRAGFDRRTVATTR